MENNVNIQVSVDPFVQGQIQNGGGVPLVFIREKTIFGDKQPPKNEWLRHPEVYQSLSDCIDSTHITGLQRVNGLWRVYLDNLEDKVKLLAIGVRIRGKVIPLLSTNPNRLDGESSLKIRTKDIPL